MPDTTKYRQDKELRISQAKNQPEVSVDTIKKYRHFNLHYKKTRENKKDALISNWLEDFIGCHCINL